MNLTWKLLLTFLIVPSLSFSVDALRATSHGPDTARTVMNLDGAMIVGAGSAIGFTVGIAGRLVDDTPLYAGAETGMFLSTQSPGYALIPLLADLYYQFHPVSRIHPLLGVLAGPFLSTGGSVSSARLAMIFRPGVNFELGRSAVLNVEPRFGLLGSEFVVMPQVGAIFAL